METPGAGGRALIPLGHATYLVLVLVWGVIRLFASEPPQVLQPSTPVLNGSAGVDRGPASKPQHGAVAVIPPTPMHVGLVGTQGASHVVVRDKNGKVVWAGDVAQGAKQKVQALPPVKVQATVGGVIEAYVKGQAMPPPAGSPLPATLTAREVQILRLIAAGWTNQEIAGHLFISPLTCKSHVSRILTKLEARDRIQLVVLAYESGLVIPGQADGLPGAPPAP